MKVKSWTDEKGNIYFNKFAVAKQSENFYGVYEKPYGKWNSYSECSLVTSGTTRDSACKKAKMLQIGFDMGRDWERDYYY